MISHCANSRCTLPFHYLRGGRLYRFDITSPSRPCADVPNAVCTLTPSRALYFSGYVRSQQTRETQVYLQNSGPTLQNPPTGPEYFSRGFRR